MSDFHWIEGAKHIVIYHTDLPQIGENDVKTLLEILNRNTGEGPGGSLIVGLPIQYHDKVKSLLKKNDALELNNESKIKAIERIKKLPLVTIPIVYLLVLACFFIFIVPSGGDFISPKGDFFLGQLGGILFIVFLIIDVVRFRR